MNVFGVSSVNADQSYNPEGESRIQIGLASLLMALLACVVFFTARLLLPLPAALVIALGAAFGTQVWSTASRGLWSDTWAIFLLSVCLYLLLSNAVGKHKLHPAILASLLAWTYFTRPTNSIAIVVIAGYVLIQRRKEFAIFLITGLGWLLGLMIYSWYHFKQLLPNYFLPGRLNFGSFATAFAGNLISPSRGLLIFLPILFFLIFLSLKYRRAIFRNRLAVAALPVIALHLIAIAGFTPWNGGFCYGPRYTTGLVPWFVLFAILGVRELLQAGAQQRKILTASVGLLLLGVSIFVNGRGATSYEAWMWNVWPQNVDKVPQKIWDWKQPQFLAGLVAPPFPQPLAVLRGRIDFGSAEADRFVWYGWSWGEKDFRWSDGREAAVAFAVDERKDSRLVIHLGAFVVKDRIAEQQVAILLNDSRLEDLVLSEEPATELTYLVDANLLRDKNTLVFKLPNAASPQSLGLSSDQRRLAIRIETIELTPVK
jgi:hypothetical protein